MTADNFARLATGASHMASTGAVSVMVITPPRFLTAGSALPGAAGQRLSSPDVPHRRHDPPGPTRRPATLPSPTRRSPRSAFPAFPQLRKAGPGRIRHLRTRVGEHAGYCRNRQQGPAVKAAAPAGSLIPFGRCRAAASGNSQRCCERM
jgi:hypothetical protein